MARVVQSHLALDDLQHIWDYIAADNRSAADKTITKLDETFEFLASNPLAGEEQLHLKSGLRRFVVGQYLIFYEPLEDGIQVVRLFHGARRYEDMF